MIPRTLRLIASIIVVGALGVLIGRSMAPVSPAAMMRQRQIDAGLDRIVPVVDFDKTPLDQAIDFLRKQTHANISANWRALEAAGIDSKTPITLGRPQISLRDALTKTATIAGGGKVRLVWYADDDGAIRFTTDEQLAAQEQVRIYDVRDLIQSDLDLRARIERAWRASGRGDESPTYSAGDPYTYSMDLLSRVIMDSVQPESWSYTGLSRVSIKAFDGRFVIIQTPQAHAQIAELLDSLRQPLQKHPAATEPR